jgi:hypothetical protein
MLFKHELNCRNAFIGPLAGIVRGGVSKAESTYEIRTWPDVGKVLMTVRVELAGFRHAIG